MWEINTANSSISFAFWKITVHGYILDGIPGWRSARETLFNRCFLASSASDIPNQHFNALEELGFTFELKTWKYNGGNPKFITSNEMSPKMLLSLCINGIC